MTIVGGFDVHRAQITFDYVETDSGQVTAGQIRPATRSALRNWLQRFDGREDVAFAVEGCTGWRFVVEELVRAKVEPHLAEPADTATLRGRKKRAKTDRADARLLRESLAQRRLPESWAPPSHVLEVRTLGRLYVALMDERRAWQQRIHAQLFHQGVPSVRGLLTGDGRVAVAEAELWSAGLQMVPAVLALTQQYGIGLLCGTIIWAELGDCRRFSNADQAVRFAGLDVTVWSSDTKRSAGRLARQGSPELRWALFEAAKCAARPTSPDHDYYDAVRDRLGGKRPALSVARKLVRRCYHALRDLGDQAWQAPITNPTQAAA